MDKYIKNILQDLEYSYKTDNYENIIKLTTELQRYNYKIIQDYFYTELYHMIFDILLDDNNGKMNYNLVECNIQHSAKKLTDMYIKTVSDIVHHRLDERGQQDNE